MIKAFNGFILLFTSFWTTDSSKQIQILSEKDSQWKSNNKSEEQKPTSVSFCQD